MFSKFFPDSLTDEAGRRKASPPKEKKIVQLIAPESLEPWCKKRRICEGVGKSFNENKTCFYLLLLSKLVLTLVCAECIEKPIEMPYRNLLCLRRIRLLVYVCSVSKNKITKPCAKKYDRLLVNYDKINSKLN